MTSRLHSLLDVSQDTTAFPWANRTLYAGLPTVAALALCLLIGHASGHAAAGSIAAGAAFTVGFAVFHETLSSTVLAMLMLTLGIASATLAASLGAAWTPLVLLLAVLASINYGLLSAISATAGWIGQQCAVYVVITSYFAYGERYAAGRTAMVLVGGGMAIALHAASDLFKHRAAPAPAQPLPTRLRQRSRELFAGLRAQLQPTGSTAGYIVKLSLTLLLSTAIYRHFGVRNGYWSPMTALLVLKPQWSQTLSRGIARFLGTLGGAAVGLLLARTVSLNDTTILVCVLLAAWACYALTNVNYAAFSLFLTLYVVFLFRFGGFSQTSAAHIRLFNTALGGIIALAVDTLWLLLPRGKQ